MDWDVVALADLQYYATTLPESCQPNTRNTPSLCLAMTKPDSMMLSSVITKALNQSCYTKNTAVQ